MLATVTVILGEEIAGPFATDHLPLVLATNAGWLIVPVWVVIRMWREHPLHDRSQRKARASHGDVCRALRPVGGSRRGVRRAR